jgi:hypothetical protein
VADSSKCYDGSMYRKQQWIFRANLTTYLRRKRVPFSGKWLILDTKNMSQRADDF